MYWSEKMSCKIGMDPGTDLSFLSFLLPGEKIRLRDDVHGQIKIRDWSFAGYGKGGIISLCQETCGYIWEAKVQDIDWDEYFERKVMSLSFFLHQ